MLPLSDPDESGFLTPWERRILADIEHEFRTSDALLVVALSDGVLPLPSWLLSMGRAALILIPLVLLLPFIWWSSIAALVASFVAFKLVSDPPRSWGRARAAGARFWSPRHR